MNNAYEITDIRKNTDFRGFTFSKFKKTDVKKELLNNLKDGNLEKACYWSAEFICAGHFLDLWEIILLFMGKNIHLGNPKIPRYIDLRYQNFKEIVMSGYRDNTLPLRNHLKIRILFAEIISILCLSTKKHPYTSVKIKKIDFEAVELADKLKAKEVSHAQRIFKTEDPKELFIAINEFIYHLRITRNASLCCYWFEWMLEFETTCKREKKKILVAHRREFAPVESKSQKDIIWIIWDIFRQEARHNHNLCATIKSLLNCFCIRYGKGSKKKRRYIVYFAISLLTEYCNWNIPIYTEEKQIEMIKKKINIIYQQIKKNETKPATDYLFNNSICEKTKNLENTLSKLDKIDSIGRFIPRI